MKRPWIIKAGGELLTLASTRKKIIFDLKKIQKSRPVVFVHGGGPQIEKELVKNKIPATFVGGRRVTSPAAMTVVERLLSGEINKGFVADLGQAGVNAVGLSGRDGRLVSAEPIKKLGRAGRPTKVDARLITHLLTARYLPVLSTVGSDTKGQAININADDFASALATKLKAERLIFMTNISGVLDGNKKRIPILKIGKIDQLVQAQVISGGMIPKVQSAKLALQKGVGEVDIVNGFHGISVEHGTRIIP
jgi:acetylglutamate kinase